MRHRKTPRIPVISTATIESLDHEGRGVAHQDGKVIFIEGALIGEAVTYTSHHEKNSYEEARTVDILKHSSFRTTPPCPHFSMCGGCAMQHFEISSQVAAKQRVLEDALWHIGKVKAESMLPPIYGPSLGYRHKARLRAKYVAAKDRVLVGFNEKHSRFIANIQSCQVLPPHISALIMPLQDLVTALSIKDQMPQIEVAVGEHVSALVFRILAPINAADEALLKVFADEHQVQIWLQSKGPDTATPLHPLDAPELSYSLPEFDLVYPFMPTEFTQVNPQINRVMVRRAMKLLNPQPNEKIADFFCGLGNFTLPIARSGATVLGLEGAVTLVHRAVQSAESNGLEKSTEFREANLFEVTEDSLSQLGKFDKWLIDPPRDGAMALVQALNAESSPSRIVYISCNPATLARDAGILVREKGYRIIAAGVVNMFPHTAHVESMAVFERN
jgi:23S rRNA (uracil1939-C5)-methyltransferase